MSTLPPMITKWADIRYRSQPSAPIYPACIGAAEVVEVAQWADAAGFVVDVEASAVEAMAEEDTEEGMGAHPEVEEGKAQSIYTSYTFH